MTDSVHIKSDIPVIPVIVSGIDIGKPLPTADLVISEPRKIEILDELKKFATDMQAGAKNAMEHIPVFQIGRTQFEAAHKIASTAYYCRVFVAIIWHLQADEKHTVVPQKMVAFGAKSL